MNETRYNSFSQSNERPCARYINGKWFPVDCDPAVAQKEIQEGNTNANFRYSPFMDDREGIA